MSAGPGIGALGEAATDGEAAGDGDADGDAVGDAEGDGLAEAPTEALPGMMLGRVGRPGRQAVTASEPTIIVIVRITRFIGGSSLSCSIIVLLEVGLASHDEAIAGSGQDSSIAPPEKRWGSKVVGNLQRTPFHTEKGPGDSAGGGPTAKK
jgi:hypothetical protein